MEEINRYTSQNEEEVYLNDMDETMEDEYAAINIDMTADPQDYGTSSTANKAKDTKEGKIKTDPEAQQTRNHNVYARTAGKSASTRTQQPEMATSMDESTKMREDDDYTTSAEGSSTTTSEEQWKTVISPGLRAARRHAMMCAARVIGRDGEKIQRKGEYVAAAKVAVSRTVEKSKASQLPYHPDDTKAITARYVFINGFKNYQRTSETIEDHIRHMHANGYFKWKEQIPVKCLDLDNTNESSRRGWLVTIEDTELLYKVMHAEGAPYRSYDSLIRQNFVLNFLTEEEGKRFHRCKSLAAIRGPGPDEAENNAQRGLLQAWLDMVLPSQQLMVIMDTVWSPVKGYGNTEIGVRETYMFMVLSSGGSHDWAPVILKLELHPSFPSRVELQGFRFEIYMFVSLLSRFRYGSWWFLSGTPVVCVRYTGEAMDFNAATISKVPTLLFTYTVYTETGATQVLMVDEGTQTECTKIFKSIKDSTNSPTIELASISQNIRAHRQRREDLTMHETTQSPWLTHYKEKLWIRDGVQEVQRPRRTMGEALFLGPLSKSKQAPPAKVKANLATQSDRDNQHGKTTSHYRLSPGMSPIATRSGDIHSLNSASTMDNDVSSTTVSYTQDFSRSSSAAESSGRVKFPRTIGSQQEPTAAAAPAGSAPNAQLAIARRPNILTAEYDATSVTNKLDAPSREMEVRSTTTSSLSTSVELLQITQVISQQMTELFKVNNSLFAEQLSAVHEKLRLTNETVEQLRLTILKGAENSESSAPRVEVRPQEAYEAVKETSQLSAGNIPPDSPSKRKRDDMGGNSHASNGAVHSSDTIITYTPEQPLAANTLSQAEGGSQDPLGQIDVEIMIHPNAVAPTVGGMLCANHESEAEDQTLMGAEDIEILNPAEGALHVGMSVFAPPLPFCVSTTGITVTSAEMSLTPESEPLNEEYPNPAQIRVARSECLGFGDLGRPAIPMGKGAFATTEIPAGYCIPYTGEEITEEEFRRRLHENEDEFLMSAGGCYQDSKEPRRRGEVGSAVNSPYHAWNLRTNGMAVANVELTYNAGTRTFAWRTTKVIRSGDEILGSYGRSYRLRYHAGHKALAIPTRLISPFTNGTIESIGVRLNRVTIDAGDYSLRWGGNLNNDRSFLNALALTIWNRDLSATKNLIADSGCTFDLQLKSLRTNLIHTVPRNGYCGWIAAMLCSRNTDNKLPRVIQWESVRQELREWLLGCGQETLERSRVDEIHAEEWLAIRHKIEGTLQHLQTADGPLPQELWVSNHQFAWLDVQSRKHLWETLPNGVTIQTGATVRLPYHQLTLYMIEELPKEKFGGLLRANHFDIIRSQLTHDITTHLIAGLINALHQEIIYNEKTSN